MAAVGRASRVLTAGVVLRRAEAREHAQALGLDPGEPEFGDDQLELVDEPLVEQKHLGPDVALILGQELPEREVGRHTHVTHRLAHFDKALGKAIRRAARAPHLGRPAADPVKSHAAVLLGRERNEIRETEGIGRERVPHGEDTRTRKRVGAEEAREGLEFDRRVELAPEDPEEQATAAPPKRVGDVHDGLTRQRRRRGGACGRAEDRDRDQKEGARDSAKRREQRCVHEQDLGAGVAARTQDTGLTIQPIVPL